MKIETINFDPEIAILRKGMLSLYHDIKILNEDVEFFRNKGYRIYLLELDRINSVPDFYDYIEKALEFPAHCGRNMDAFEDNLCELNLNGYCGGLLLFLGYDTFIKMFPDIAFLVLDVIANVARLYLIYGIKLIALIQVNDTNISLPKVGGYYIDANSREAFIINEC